MATLPSGILTEVSNRTMQELSAILENINLSRSDFEAVVVATDQWISDNAAAFNQSLPDPGRTNLTSNQKWRIFRAVADRRFSEGV